MMLEKLTAVLADHLWQSTLFGAAVALLAVVLRKNRAQARYALWLSASLKFLIPFPLFVAIGSHLKWSAVSRIAHPALPAAVEQISNPFSGPMAASPIVQLSAPAPLHSFSTVLFAIVFAIWICGFTVVLLLWTNRWLRLRAMLREATPIALPVPIQAFSSASRVEPGVFGIIRPVLLLPAGITDHLPAEHLDAVFAHELCHVRRRDNLSAALHMLVEAIFWFHPLVWWIGVRLVEERERACDEEVLLLGKRPQIYAESILKTCQFYFEAPIRCMSGVTGSDLKERIVRIMSGRMAGRLAFWKKLLLGACASAAVILPLAVGVLNPRPTRAQTQDAATATPVASFEVASVKPDKSGGFGVALRIAPGGSFSAHGVPLKLLIEEAYNVKDSQISGEPAWASSERFDIDAKADEATAAEMDKMKPEERKQTLMLMLQSLLADRFQLKLSRSTKELPVYALVVGKNGPKLKKSDSATPDSPPPPPPTPPPLQAGGPGPVVKGAMPKGGVWMMGPGHLNINGAPLDRFVDVLSRLLGRPVINKTGLAGNYDFTLNWTPDENQGPLLPGGPPPGLSGAITGGPVGAGPGGSPGPETATPDSSGPNLFTAIQEQLGLKLESQKGPVELLVIEHVERPSEN